MPKSLDPIWDHWIDSVAKGKQPADPSKVRAKCKYCKGHEQQKNASRCKEHTSKCPQAPTDVREQFMDFQIRRKKNLLLRDEEPIASKKMKSDEEPADYASASVGCSLGFYVNKMSKEMVDEYKLLWGKAMINGNISFNWLKDPFLRGFFKKVGIEKLLPTEREMEGRIQNKLLSWANNEIKNELEKAETMTIGLDAWTNENKRPVVNMVCCIPKPVFWKTFETGSESQTGTYLADKLKIEIKKIGSKKVSAI